MCHQPWRAALPRERPAAPAREMGSLAEARRPSALGELASPVYSTVALTVCAGVGAIALWRTHAAGKELEESAAAAAEEEEKQVQAARESEEAAARESAAPEPESFGATVERCFGETLRLDDFTLSLTSALRAAGFTRDNTLTTLSLPRDPLITPLREQLQKLWGEGISLSSLSGLPLLGQTGLRAACGAGGAGALGWRRRPRTLIVACGAEAAPFWMSHFQHSKRSICLPRQARDKHRGNS
eukprot:COSAG06_NODE_167_length_21546_cov_35.001352_3_plen_242_part_00